MDFEISRVTQTTRQITDDQDLNEFSMKTQCEFQSTRSLCSGYDFHSCSIMTRLKLRRCIVFLLTTLPCLCKISVMLRPMDSHLCLSQREKKGFCLEKGLASVKFLCCSRRNLIAQTNVIVGPEKRLNKSALGRFVR